MTKRKLLVVSGWAIVVSALALGQRALESQQPTVEAPMFEVDPFWPKPLPNHWVLGSTIGVWVDERDHVWIIHRSSATLSNMEKGAELKPPTGECCAGAPPVLEFDPNGNLVQSWGGPGQGYEWPQSNHGIFLDHKGNVWIGGNGQTDAHVLKFAQDGRLLMQFGRSGQNAGSHPERRAPPAHPGALEHGGEERHRGGDGQRIAAQTGHEQRQRDDGEAGRDPVSSRHGPQI